MTLRELAHKTAPILEAHDYPRRWQDYVGQDPAKKMLKVAARSARVRKQPLGHVLISHPSPGIGKTALAVLLATELRTNARVVSGPTSRDRARLILSTMNDGDVLFYDEFHQCMDGGRKNAEWLLTFLQDGVIAGPLGAEEQPKVTVVAATTDAGKVLDSIIERFKIVPPMQDYSNAEATKIAQKMCGGVLEVEGLPRLGARDASAIAQAAANNPRAIRRLLENLRDLVITEELPLLKGRYDVDGLLAFQGITPDGLDRMAQKYLLTLATEFDGSAGAKALEDRLQQPGGLATTERILMDMGFVAKTRSGRTLTQAGIRRFNELEPTA